MPGNVDKCEKVLNVLQHKHVILSLEGDMENATGGDFFYTHIYRIIKATNPKTGWPNRIIHIVRLCALELVYK